MKISTIFLYFLFFSNSVLAQPENLLKTWDEKVYNPRDFGLNSLSFEARVSGLTENLKSNLIIPSIKDVFFRVTWNIKKGFSVKLVGLPIGFTEIKNSLEITMVDKLRFFIPNKIFESMQGYELSAQKLDSGIQYSLDDKTFLKEITKIEVFFNAEKKLSKVELKGREINTFTYERQPDSQKLLLKNLLVEFVGDQSTYAMSYEVNYTNVEKYYFPKSINIISKLQSSVGEKGQKQVFAEVKSKITFSNFLVK